MRHFRSFRKHLRGEAGDEEPEPLTKVKRRCVAGAGVCFTAYLAIIASPVLWPSTVALWQAVSLEIGIGILGLLLTLVAIVIWLLTESTAFVLSVSKAVSAAMTANAALRDRLLGESGPEGTPIPIQRGREIREHRTDRHAG
jgi:hypothetical protein